MSTANTSGRANLLYMKTSTQYTGCPESQLPVLAELYGRLDSFKTAHTACLNQEYLMYDVQKAIISIEQYCWEGAAFDSEFTTHLYSHLICIMAMIEFSLNTVSSNDNLQSTREDTQNHLRHIRALGCALTAFKEIMHFAKANLKSPIIEQDTP